MCYDKNNVCLKKQKYGERKVKYSNMRKRQKPEPKPSEKNIKFPVEPVKADYLYGLTKKQVQERAAAGWSNEEVGSVSLSTKDIVKKNVFTYFNLIFAVLAVLVCLSGSFRDLTFLPVILLNTVVGIVQEIRAKNVLEKMNMLNAPKTDVVREGKIRSIDSTHLVRDDIVIFNTGNQICADAVVCSGEVRVNESLLTGESEEIVKKEGDSLMSGSFIVSGKCYARLEKVGDESYISRLTLKAKAMKDEEQSEMIRSLDKLVKTVGIALIPIGIILFIQSFFISHEGFQGSITSMVGGGDRHDPGGPLSADNSGSGPEQRPAGYEQGAAPRYEEYRDPGQGQCPLRGQDRDHYGKCYDGPGYCASGRGTGYGQCKGDPVRLCPGHGRG